MDDLRLYELLGDPDADVDEVVPLLGELTRREPPSRGPWIGRLGPWLGHPAARARAAAVRALGGAAGRVAVAAIVKALDDGDADVRAAAAEAMLATAQVSPARVAHLVFHARPDVRRAAYDVELLPEMRPTAAHRLADPDFDGRLPELDLAHTPVAIDLVMDLTQAGRLPAADARAWLLAGKPPQHLAWADQAPRRGSEEATRAIESEGEHVAGADRLDALFARFGDEASAAEREAFFRGWLGFSRGHPLPVARRYVAALIAAGGGRWTAEALGVAVYHLPELLSWSGIPQVTRRAALDAVYTLRGPRAASPALLEELMRGSLVQRGGGHVDLRVAGALALYSGKPPYRWLVDHLGLDTIVTSFLRDPEEAAPFLSNPDAAAEGRAWMIERLLERAGDQASFVHAIAACTAGGKAPDLTFLSRAAPAMRLEMLEHLLGFERRPGLAFDHSHATRLGNLLADGSVADAELLARWLDRVDCAESNLGPELLRRMADRLSGPVLATVIHTLSTKHLRRALEAIDARQLLSFAKLQALGAELESHPSTAIAEWAERHRRRSVASGPGAFAGGPAVRDLPEAMADAIATGANLLDALEPVAGRPFRGVVAALRERRAPATPTVEVAAIVLGCHDDPVDVAQEFEAWVEPRAAFLEALDAYALKIATRHPRPPLLLKCWLWRFERFGLAAGAEMIEGEGGLLESLKYASALPSSLLAEHCWATAARTVAVWRHRSPESLKPVEARAEALVSLCIAHLDHDEGLYAARLLRGLNDAGVGARALRDRLDELRARLPDMADEARAELHTIVSSRGLPSRARGARADRGRAAEDELAQIRAETDLDVLARRCHSEVLAIVHEATLRLVAHGEEGQRRLAWLLAGDPLPIHFDAITASLALWEDADPLEAVRFALHRLEGRPALRFHLAMGLAERGDDTLELAVDAVMRGGDGRWLRRSDADALFDRAGDARAFARRLVASPQPAAYARAVQYLLSRPDPAPEDDEALRAFLRQGSERWRDLRLAAARHLHDREDGLGLPLLIEQVLAGGDEGEALFARADERLVRATVETLVLCGDLPCDKAVVGWLADAPTDVREECLERLLAEAQQIPTRSMALTNLPRRPRRSAKLRALAEMFAWGRDVSRELTGQLLTPHMISGEGLGYTRLNERRVFVSPLPLLRGDRQGREVVEGLILHEIGHHRHHKGPQEHAIWSKADSQGLGRLLNLVADEHLERNIRAYDEDYGNRLKRLDAYAFQHADRDVMVHVLLSALRARAFDVLTACPLDAATHPQAVRVGTGAVLRELERHGSSFARFTRALRMGLGDRHDDPKVRDGLALFSKSFRKLDMRGLWKITKQVHAIFGDEVRLAFAFGGAESLEGDPWGQITHGDEIGDGDVQREVERILGSPDKSGASGGHGRPGRLQINVGGDDSFDVIRDIVKVDPDPASHREMARGVGRHARRLRQFLHALGLSLEPQRMRLRGRRLDTTRLRPLVVRGDPRVLLAREIRWHNDLFLGLIVDCSGSMHGQSMERAHAFGVLLTEAVRGLPGVDLRIFGFTDTQIFDAGDAKRPAVTSLRATAGNNDAAGLWHCAQEARRSPREAKVLVMISDGLPTECSVAALRGLVRMLTRRHGLVCAQVAVRPLEEICFPHYVEVDESNLDAAVARFGQIVARLVGRTLRSS